MKIINQSVHIMVDKKDPNYGETILKRMECIARVCYKSEDKITEDGESARNLITKLVASGHDAMLEHAHVSVKFITDRGITHEIVRHRMASFAQESTRYCNYMSDKFGNEITVIKPPNLIKNTPQYSIWLTSMMQAESAYFGMLNAGCSPQEARAVLPNSLKAEIVVTANIREWRHILKLRCGLGAHPQMRELMNGLALKFKKDMPILFDDILVVQSE